MEHDLALLDKEAESFVQNLGVPPCPAILMRVLREVRAEDPDFGRVSSLIGTDVALSAAMLSTVNSAYYGLRTKAETVQRALQLLGLQTCSHLVTRLSLIKAFPISNNVVMKRYWANAVRGSLVAGVVAKATRGVDPELAATYSLFRDVGMPVLLSRYPNYADLMTVEKMYQGPALLEAEKAHGGMNHVRVGFQMARSWDLLPEMCLAIYHHHDYAIDAAKSDGAPALAKRLVAVGLVADAVAARVTRTKIGEWALSEEWAFEQLSIGEPDMDEMVRTAATVAPGA